MTIKVTVHMKSGKDMVMELYPEKAPNAINSLIEMIDQGCFENMVIQRIAPDFVFQPWFDESRMDERFQYVIDVEANDLPFKKYCVGVPGDGEGAVSCGGFYIVAGDGHEAKLTGKYTAMGYLVDGFEEFDRLMHVPMRDVETGMTGVVVKEPVEPEVITDMTYELNGYQPQAVVNKRIFVG